MDVIKPSNIRKRNFSASLVQSVDQEERWQGIPDPSKNKIKEVEEKKTVVNEDIKGERGRGAIARDVSVIVPKKDLSDWERSRINVRRGSGHDVSSSLARGGGRGALGGGGVVGLSRGQPPPVKSAGGGGGGDSKPDQPRRRIRLNRSMMRKPYHQPRQSVAEKAPLCSSPITNLVSNGFPSGPSWASTRWCRPPPARHVRTMMHLKGRQNEIGSET